MATKKTGGEEASEKSTKTLLQRTTSIVKMLEPCTPDERRRILLSVEALSGNSAPVPEGTLTLPNLD